MVDKATTVPRVKLGARIGQVDGATMQAVDAAMRGFLGL
jgi:mRNA-degrading endonuclease toxin of MazEF toxin-antitoxin module